MPQYLISVWHDDDYADNDFNDPDTQRLFKQVGAVNEEMERTSVWVFGAGLQPQSTARVLRAAGAEVSVTDGPYAETKEQMGGFWVIEVPDLDIALEWAGKCAAACEGPVELRPMQTVDPSEIEQERDHMAQYLISVWHDRDYTDEDWNDPEIQRTFRQTGAVIEEMQSAGVWVFHAGLQPQSTATVVRAGGGDVSMTDGPYAETKEQMAGFWVIDVPDLDAATKWAGKCTAACENPVELRPMQTGD